jgi:predicted glycogen debranching enzyme
MAPYSIETYGELNPYLSFEWLLTNGLGGFASSTVVACSTRRYHGLLCAATTPPVGRVIALNRMGELFVFDGKTDQILRTSISQFNQTFFPRGEQYLRKFELGDVATWHYEVEGVRIVKEVLAVWQRNIVGIRYTLEADAGRLLHLQAMPFVSMRDFHALRSASNAYYQIAGGERKVSVTEGDLVVHVEADAGRFEEKGDWWYKHTYALETERGQDDTEDLFCPGSFVYETTGKGRVTLWAGIEPTGLLDWDAEAARRASGLGFGVRGPADTQPKTQSPKPQLSRIVERLTHAAADFIVQRRQPDGSPGCTVMAGYPWFADWGRDTMISLPGLFLTTGRFAEAGQVLSVFAQYVSEGMIPNRFDDYSNEPHYNTVDASLWFIHAAYEYLRLSHDKKIFDAKLLPACRAIVEGYRKGTRFKIAMDPVDSLIAAGDESTQLTWMDAKCGGIAFTPRQGKAIEINALWYNALKLMGMDDLAAKVAESFQKKFWLSPFRGCYDVVSEAAKDAQVRPNQIFAASLPHSPLTIEQRKAVVEVVRRELLTPYGLRTLARGEPNYRGRYTGDQMIRDAAYHNGTVWPWLIGAFLEAYLNVNERSTDAILQARIWLKPLIDSMDRGCIGQIAEIFEGDEPHRPVGCFAQAWSVAEVLRLAVQLGM